MNTFAVIILIALILMFMAIPYIPVKPPPPPPKEHDYRRNVWGHAIEWCSARDTRHGVTVLGWGYGIFKGDRIRIRGRDKVTHEEKDVLLVVRSIEYFRDPRDMWKAELVEVPS